MFLASSLENTSKKVLVCLGTTLANSSASSVGRAHHVEQTWEQVGG